MILSAFIMGKVKKPIDCFQSPTGSTPPKCNQSPATLCESCGIAMIHYNQIKEFKKVARRQKNRNSARLSKMKKEEKFSDLLATNMALTLEHEELAKDLEKINAANEAAKEEIYAKIQEILAATFI